jgi:hypothetical protein
VLTRNKFSPDYPDVSKIDANLCTHLLVIGRCNLDDRAKIILPTVEVIEKYNRLKDENPNLKVLITLTPTTNQLMSRLVRKIICLLKIFPLPCGISKTP